MRDIREDLKERVASVTAELDELKKREALLSAIQQSLFGLLEEEDRRFSDRIPHLIESTPNNFDGPELPKISKVSQGSWADLQRAAAR